MGGGARLWTGLWLVCGLAVGARCSVLSSGDVYLSTEADGLTVLAPNAYLGGEPLDTVSATQLPQCTAACLDNPSCAWFNHCNEQGGCNDAFGALRFHQCRLLASNCTLIPQVTSRSTTGGATAGLPVRTTPPHLPGYAIQVGQGLQADDLECPGVSTQEGICALDSVIDAAAVCSYLARCRAVMVYTNGTDGCSNSQRAVLKSSNLSPTNTFVAPTVYTLEMVQDAPLSLTYLLAGEAALVPPNDDELADWESGATGEALANSTSWLGCLVAQGALMEGDVYEVLNGVDSAVECCRQCRALQGQNSLCNAWNYCGREEGCSFTNLQVTVSLAKGDCELRFQPLATPDLGWPPAVLTKGPNITFTAGTPIAVTGPTTEGFTRYMASGLFGQPGVDCPGSLTPELQDCVLQGSFSDLADYCRDSDPCAAFVYKPAGIANSPRDVAYFRNSEGANTSLIILSGTSVLYMKEGGGTQGGGGGLSAGAAAGIAVGAVAVAVAAAGGAWALWRRRRRRRRGTTSLANGSLNGKLVSSNTEPGGYQHSQYSQPSHTLEDGQGNSGGNSNGNRTVLGVANGGGNSGGSGTSANDTVTYGLRTDGGTTPGNASSLGHTARGSLDGGRPAVSFAGGPGSSQAVGLAGSAAGSLEMQPIMPPFPNRAPQMEAVLSRPTMPSPFAAQSHVGLGSGSGGGSSALPPGISATSALSPGGPSTSGGSADGAAANAHQRQRFLQQERERRSRSSGGGEGEGSAVLHELMHHRERQSSRSGSAEGGGGGKGPDSSGSGTPPLVLASLPPSLREWVLPRDAIEYLIGTDGAPLGLGEGASGRVYKAVWNGEVVAAKEMDIGSSFDTQRSFVAEAGRLVLLRHANVVAFYGVALSGAKGVLLMELCEGRDLQSVLQLSAAGTQQRLFSWARRGRRVALEVARAVNYLHTKNVVHMDIKSSNVLLSASGTAKLADVGLSRMQTKTVMSDLSLVGTFAWAAPEILMGGTNCTRAVDIYSFGVLLWEIITGERPVRGNLRMPRVPQECPQEVVDLMMQCLKSDPSARPSAQQLMQRLADMVGGGSGAISPPAMERVGSRPLGPG